MNAKEVRAWCMLQPRPKKIRITVEDGSTKEIAPPRGGQTWAGLAESIVAFGPVLIEALEDDGSVIRARNDDYEDDDDEPEEKHPPLPVTADPETQRLHHFSTLLATHARFAIETAFRELSSMFRESMENNKSTNARLERMEAAYRREQQHRIDDLWDHAEAAVQASAGDKPQSFQDEMFEAFVRGQWARRNEQNNPPPNGKTNATGKANGKAGGVS